MFRITQFNLASSCLVLGLAAAPPVAAAAQQPQAPGGQVQARSAPGAAQAAQAAAAPGQIRIAVIDTEKILLSSVAGKKALAELKKIQEQKAAEINSKQTELKELQDKMANQKLGLADEKMAEITKQIEDKVIVLRRLQDDANRELNKRKDDLLGSIDEKVMPVINQAGKDLGYTLIFRKFESGLIYADEGLDITNTIIQRLDAAQQGK
jgi:outer membrane protein